MKMSKLIAEESRAYSVNIVPLINNYFEIQIFVKGKNEPLKKIVKNIEEDVIIPTISNDTVKHLGYNSYQYYQPIKKGFFINFYKH